MKKSTRELWQRPRAEYPSYLSDMDTRFPVTTTKPGGTLALDMDHLRHPKYILRLRTRAHGLARKGTTKPRET